MEEKQNFELEVVPEGDSDFFERELEKYSIKTETFGVTGKTRYHIFIDDNIEVSINYRKHFTVLREASKGDEIVFYINSYGGYLDTALQFINAMNETDAKTIAVIYTAASAATLIAFAADKVVAYPLSTIMLHNFSTHQQGKGSEIRAKVAFDDRQFSALCDYVYKDILSQEEIKQLQADDDFWFLGSSLNERMEKYNWVPIRSRNG